MQTSLSIFLRKERRGRGGREGGRGAGRETVLPVCSPVAIHAFNSCSCMICLLKIYKAKPPALPTAVAHDHCAGNCPKVAKNRPQDLLIHIAANIPHIHIAKFPRLSCSVLQPLRYTLLGGHAKLAHPSRESYNPFLAGGLEPIHGYALNRISQDNILFDVTSQHEL